MNTYHGKEKQQPADSAAYKKVFCQDPLPGVPQGITVQLETLGPCRSLLEVAFADASHSGSVLVTP